MNDFQGQDIALRADCFGCRVSPVGEEKRGTIRECVWTRIRVEEEEFKIAASVEPRSGRELGPRVAPAASWPLIATEPGGHGA